VPWPPRRRRSGSRCRGPPCPSRSLRSDLDPELLLALFSGLIKAALEATAAGRAGTEQAAAAVTSLFLHGAAEMGGGGAADAGTLPG
jgi:hypothetical protein